VHDADDCLVGSLITRSRHPPSWTGWGSP